VVESQPSKLLVAGSIPVSRSNLRSPDMAASVGWQASLRHVFVAPKVKTPVDMSAVAPETKRLADVSAVAPQARRPM
jgi:hypothetical protein